jgi:hypothetical protein
MALSLTGSQLTEQLVARDDLFSTVAFANGFEQDRLQLRTDLKALFVIIVVIIVSHQRILS